MGGVFMVSLSGENRRAAGVAGADEVDVGIELDTAPREVAVPADLAAALDAEPAARRSFEGLSNSNKSWHVLQVEGARPKRRASGMSRSVETWAGWGRGRSLRVAFAGLVMTMTLVASAADRRAAGPVKAPGCSRWTARTILSYCRVAASVAPVVNGA
jgi:hypothetical protein